MMFPWFLCHMFLRGPMWELKGYLLGLMDLDIRLISGYSGKFPRWIFSDFLKISTDKPQYNAFFDYWIIEKVTAILITPE